MATPATRVAASAVVLSRLLGVPPLFHVRPTLEHQRKRGKGGVQGILGRCYYLLMAIPAGLFRIIDAWKGIEARMGGGLVRAGRIATVAGDAVNFAVGGGKKILGNKDLL
ncbi:MAG: hypothetical protein P4L38_04000 [Syntrophaceae bacterium]|nr:hypothetical protein [Syntrophaceae bacterium]